MTIACTDFGQEPVVTISSGTSTSDIAESTHRLVQCVQEQLSHLDKRARAFATCAHFEAALRDATTMQQLNPSSAAGYLCAGHVYSMQGRQKAAIEIYDKGLAVVPLSDSSYQHLVDAQSIAQEIDNKVIDFIKAFPVDIIEHIAPKILSEEEMTPSELEEYLGVSRVWREKLLLGIQELCIGTVDEDLVNYDDLFEQVGPYCTSLSLDHRTTGFAHLVSKANFHSLRHLDCSWYDKDLVQNPKETLGFLSSLTHLTIETYQNPNLADILNACPHLVCLVASEIDDDMSTAPECHPRLKTLRLSDYDDPFDIHGITKRLPALQVFSAYPFVESKDLMRLQDNCPRLKVIGCNDYCGWHGYVPTITANDDQGPQDATFGVHILYVGYYETTGFYIKDKDLMDSMIRNRHTLQDVYFCAPLSCVDTEENDPSNTSILSHAIQAAANDKHDDRFNEMARYEQCIYHRHSLLMARWVARKAPHLKEMELVQKSDDNFDFQQVDTSALFDDLIGLYELDTVKISLDTSADMSGIERFIRYHSTYDSQLHTLTLPKNTRLSMDTLELLATLSRLENLSISLPLVQDEDPDGAHFSRFIHKLALGCPQLKHLEIRTDGPIHDNIFIQLSELHITSLGLEVGFYKYKLPLGLLSLTQCPKLQALHIDTPYRRYPHQEIRNMLRNKINTVTGI